MSYFESNDPECQNDRCPPSVALEIIPRSVDLGGFKVSRVLPSSTKKTVGPFVFFDQAGPGEFLTGNGLDVRPHPHICLSTMTYLFAGRLEHRDTLGSHQIIMPGDVNLMTAGCGIAHSERTPKQDRTATGQLYGIQSWLALPLNKEEMLPTFTHHSSENIPSYQQSDINFHVVCGNFMDLQSPVNTQNDALFVTLTLQANAQFTIPNTIEERAIFILSGEISVDHQHYGHDKMLILKPGIDITIKANTQTHLIVLGGSALTEERYLWWNFVASNKERIEQAKSDWQDGKFGKIPGDDKEFIPLPN